MLVDRAIEPKDLFWPVIKNLVEQWKALMKKKKADVGQPPKLTKDKLVYKWLEQFQQYLSDKIGVRNYPFTYLTCPSKYPLAVFGPCAVDQPYSMEYKLIEHKLQLCMLHALNLFQADNTALFQVIDCVVVGRDVLATIALFCCTQNGRGAFMAIVAQHAG